MAMMTAPQPRRPRKKGGVWSRAALFQASAVVIKYCGWTDREDRGA